MSFPPVRRQALHALSNEDPLVYVHAERFDGLPGMVSSWLDRLPQDSIALSVVLDADPERPENNHWAHIQSELGTPSPRTAVARAGSAFQNLCASISASDRRVVLVLDLGESVSDPVSRVGDLLDSAPDAGLKLVWVTRSSDPHLEALVRRRRHTFVPPDDMLFDSGDIAATLRYLELEFDGRAPTIIREVTGGLADLVDVVCTMAPADDLTETTHLAGYAEAVVDKFLNHSIRTDPALAPHHDEILLSAAANPLTRDTARVLELTAAHGSATSSLFETLVRSGMVDLAGTPTEVILRFPEALRGSLLRLASARVPDRLRDYRAALADHWLDNGRPDHSIRHAADAELWEKTLEILEEHSSTLYTRDYPVKLLRDVLAEIPDEILAEHPVLVSTHDVLTQLASPRGGIPTSPSVRAPRAEKPDVNSLVMEMATVRLEGRFTEATEVGDEILRFAVADPAFLKSTDADSWAFCCVHVGISYMLTGRFLDAIPLMLNAFQSCDNTFIHRDAAGKLALCETFLANRAGAVRWIDEERRAPTLPPDTERIVRPAGDVAAALTALDQLDTDSAGAILRSLGAPDDTEELWGFILYAQASYALMSGAAADGLRYLNLHRSRFTSMIDNDAVSKHLLDAISAELHLACDQPEAARACVAASTHPLTAPVRARVALLTDDRREAEGLARRSLMSVECTARHAIDLNLTAAAALLAAGEHDQAKHFVDSAVAGITHSGFLRPIRSFPPRILRELARLNPELPIEAELTRPEFGTLTLGESGDTTQSEPEIPTPTLTTREFAVLRDLTSESSVREISMRHSVSVSTIKTQVRSIYRKLGVNSRSAAVARARELGLLD